jgi:hypothetical protein
MKTLRTLKSIGKSKASAEDVDGEASLKLGGHMMRMRTGVEV